MPGSTTIEAKFVNLLATRRMRSQTTRKRNPALTSKRKAHAQARIRELSNHS
jgi:hypothetical protein